MNEVREYMLNWEYDHYSVKNVVKQKRITIPNNWNKANLQDKSKLKEYRQYLHNKLERKREEQDINNERRYIRNPS
jgi:hypothetical protein